MRTSHGGFAQAVASLLCQMPSALSTSCRGCAARPLCGGWAGVSVEEFQKVLLEITPSCVRVQGHMEPLGALPLVRGFLRDSLPRAGSTFLKTLSFIHKIFLGIPKHPTLNQPYCEQ